MEFSPYAEFYRFPLVMGPVFLIFCVFCENAHFAILKSRNFGETNRSMGGTGRVGAGGGGGGGGGGGVNLD